jgi:acyl carrier protein
MLREEQGGMTVGEMRRRLREEEGGEEGEEAEEMREIGEENGYRAEVGWGGGEEWWKMEVKYERRGEGEEERGGRKEEEREEGRVEKWERYREYANKPGQWEKVTRIGEELGRYIRERVPEYMVPSGYVELPRMPLTPNGKLDRKALPSPVFRGEKNGKYLGPRNETEATLCSIWTEVLGIEDPGVRDNFFELGGHSLTATRAVSRIRSALGAEVSLRTFFANPTVSEMASYLEQDKNVPREQATSIQPDTGWEKLINEIEGLSEAEAEALLLTEMGRIEPTPEL